MHGGLSPILAIIPFLLFSACEASPQETASRIDSDIQAIESGLYPLISFADEPMVSIEQRMAFWNVPGVSIAYFNREGLVWAKGYGRSVANGASVDADTIFPAASISKSVAATAALHLIETSDLELDSDIGLLLKGWRIPDSQFGRNQPITIRQLLSHTAGFAEYGFETYGAGEPIPTVEQLLKGQPPAKNPPIELASTPGTSFAYSNIGYAILELLITEQTGASFETLVQETVLGPLGMTRTTFTTVLPNKFKNAAARGHDALGKPFGIDFPAYPSHASGAMWTTPSDLSRFAAELLKARVGMPSDILSPESVSEMTRDQSNGNGYGLGVMLIFSPTEENFGHSGHHDGFYSTFVAFPASGDGAVIMSNGEGGERLNAEIFKAMADTYGWKGFERNIALELEPSKLETLAGTYQGPGGGDIVFGARQGRLYLEQNPGRSALLYPIDQRRFTVATGRSVFEFKFEGDAPTSVTILQPPRPMIEAKRRN